MEYVRVPKVDWIAILDKIRTKTGSADKLLSGSVPSEIDRIQSGGVLDGSNITFGSVDGLPVEREESYLITSEKLNELGTITQTISGKKVLMTVDDMIYWLSRAQFIPQGNTEKNMFDLTFDYSTSGKIPEVQIGTTTNVLDLSFESSVVGVLQEV